MTSRSRPGAGRLDRWSRLSELLAEADCEALIVLARDGRDPHLAPFLQGGRPRRCYLVAPRDSAPRLGYATPMERDEAAASGLDLLTPGHLDIVRWTRGGAPPDEALAGILARALQLCEVPPGRVALAGLAEVGRGVGAARRLADDGWTLVPGESIPERLRRRKTAAEIEEIRRVVAGVEEAFRRVAEILASADDVGGDLWLGGERLRVGRLRAEVADVSARHGLEQPEGNIIAPGREGAIPHSMGTDERCLRAGEAIVVDLFPRGRLFADATRTFCVGEVPETLRNAHGLVAEALGAAIRKVHAGVVGWDLQAVVCELFESADHPTPRTHPGGERGYVHGLGHGVGFELHELPSFREHARKDGALRAGDVFTIEPGLYEPSEGWGVRLEQLFVMKDDEPELLTRWPLDLDPRAWRI